MLYYKCLRCGQVSEAKLWGEGDKYCPYCKTRNNYTSVFRIFPLPSGRIDIPQQPAKKTPTTFDDFERASTANNDQPGTVWKCGYCNHYSPAQSWVNNSYKCPRCGHRSIQHEVKISRSTPQEQTSSGVSQQPVQSVQPQPAKPAEVESSAKTTEESSSKPVKKSLPIIVKIGIVVLIAAVVMMIANGQRPTSTSSGMTPVTEKTEVTPDQVTVQVQPVDIKSVDYVQTEQIIIIILLIAIVVTGWLDRKMSNQPWDAYLAIAAAILVLFGASKAAHFVATAFESWGVGTLVACRILSVIIASLCVVTVILVSLYGTLDLTPVGMFFGILGLGGGVLLGHMGSLQEALKIPTGFLLPLGQVFQYLRAKDVASVAFSLLVYACLVISVLAELREVLKPYKSGSTSFGGLALSIINIVIYILLRMFGGNISGSFGGLASSPYGALLIFFVLNLIAAAFLRERVDNMFGNTTTDYKMGQARVMTPWDILLFQSVLGGTLTILFHAI